MKPRRLRPAAAILCVMVAAGPSFGEDLPGVRLPPGVRAVWDLRHAHRESTPTRERVCLNGLWRWQPAPDVTDNVPAGRWGFFKVPGPWPGLTDYMQKDCQRMYAHPDWQETKLSGVTAAWYQRSITIPAEWAGRRLAVQVEWLNSYASVHVDGRKVGDLQFPGGEVEVTSACRAGGEHVLSLLVVALPLKGVMLSYNDTASARTVKGSVARRGLCGDVYLVATPSGARIAEVRVDPSVRREEMTCDVALLGLAEEARYALRAQVTGDGRPVAAFTSQSFQAGDLKNGRVAFTQKWKPERLWDLHTPGNMYQVEVSLLNAGGRVLDAGWAERFGFREFWIDGRDFFLNGTRVFLAAVPLDNAQLGAAWATYASARESLERLQSFGINLVYTHNYGCEPGAHLSFAEILRAADDVGMLVAVSQPHFSHYEWKASDADQHNGYARHAAFYARQARNHPSVVFYSMSHNATGYNEDMNPDLIDGRESPRDRWALNNAQLALRAEAIVHRLDPGRIVYHHSSGNLGSMHTINFYANFAPVQELSDWFEHWALEGVKPLFTCEYAVPATWDWTMYRGWYRGQREFGSAAVPWEFCLAEWNAQFAGDRAFQISAAERANLRWEAKQFRAGNLWHRWDYPVEVGSTRFDERFPVLASYVTENWRAFRTWGVSAINPWEYGLYWKLREGVNKQRLEFPVDWENLQRPGFSPDYLDQRYERMDLAYERSDWVPTAAALALIRNNRPLLAYIGGKPSAFTSKDHNIDPGATVEKQLIIINNSRETVTCRCEWSVDLPQTVSGSREVAVATGNQARIPVRWELPVGLAPERHELSVRVQFSSGEVQSDSFAVHLVPFPPVPPVSAKVAVYDPQGETTRWLQRTGIRFQAVNADTSLSAFDILVVGKSALTVEGPAPDIRRVRDGLKVLAFEQTAEVLEKRLGFRVAEYGLRRVFKRVPDHPLLAGIAAEHLRDWRGEATLVPSRLRYETRPRYGPTVRWCDIPVTRLWRCGNRGNVASVLIEKPARGDFLPILDGGYSLQYSPLLEFHEGQGMILFCQLDVTGRTETDPAAETLARNALQYLSAWKPAPARQALYLGAPAGMSHLESAGVAVTPYKGGTLTSEQVLIVGPLGGEKLAGHAAAISEWLKAGGHLLAVGLDEREANAFLPFRVTMKPAEHIAAFFEPFARNSLLAGVGPAEVHNRDPRELPLVSGGAVVFGDGVLARAENADVVFCQLAPWQFDSREPSNVKRTFRRTSVLLGRLLANLGVRGATPILGRFHRPAADPERERRWQEGLYLDRPEEWDDPYRFFRW